MLFWKGMEKRRVTRYEDNGDNATHFLVISRDSDKGSIQGYGDQAKFLSSTLTPLLGEQVFKGGRSRSERAFKTHFRRDSIRRRISA